MISYLLIKEIEEKHVTDLSRKESEIAHLRKELVHEKQKLAQALSQSRAQELLLQKMQAHFRTLLEKEKRNKDADSKLYAHLIGKGGVADKRITMLVCVLSYYLLYLGIEHSLFQLQFFKLPLFLFFSLFCIFLVFFFLFCFLMLIFFKLDIDVGRTTQEFTGRNRRTEKPVDD
jgi:hypothetical protein